MSVNLMFGEFFSVVYKCLCHVAQIVSPCGELDAPGVRRSIIYVLHSGEMGFFLEA
jgi:hypothetical protein